MEDFWGRDEVPPCPEGKRKVVNICEEPTNIYYYMLYHLIILFEVYD